MGATQKGSIMRVGKVVVYPASRFVFLNVSFSINLNTCVSSLAKGRFVLWAWRVGSSPAVRFTLAALNTSRTFPTHEACASGPPGGAAYGLPGMHLTCKPGQIKAWTFFDILRQLISFPFKKLALNLTSPTITSTLPPLRPPARIQRISFSSLYSLASRARISILSSITQLTMHLTALIPLAIWLAATSVFAQVSCRHHCRLPVLKLTSVAHLEAARRGRWTLQERGSWRSTVQQWKTRVP